MELPSPSRRLLSSIVLFALAATSVSAIEISGTTVTLYNASDFIELSENVNSGITSYDGSTVLLGDDIDFADYSEDFEPIGVGTSTRKIFKGSFDGQGHTISNLIVNSSQLYVGLFSTTSSPTLKNFVIDSSCSLTSTFNFTSEFGVVGWIAYFQPTSASTSISGVVNMGNVTSAMAIDDKTEVLQSVGGVVGCIDTRSYGSTIRNCVNYGAITDYGVCMYVAIGGVLGALGNTKFIQKNGCDIMNCANYGRIVHRGKMSGLLVMGGIVGAPFKTIAKNCINFDIFDTDWVSSAIGKIIGAVDDNSDVYRCFWTNEADNVNNSCGFNYLTSPTIAESYFVESNTATMDLLNSWVSEENEKESEPKYTRWMMLHLGSGGGMNTVREETLIVPQLKFPAPNREGHSFIRWCADSECTTGEYNGTLGNVTDLYAMWKANNYTVTFDYGNGTLVSESFTFNTTIIYPGAPIGEGIYGWNSSIEKMPAYDIAIGPNTTPPPKSSKSNVGAIAGGVVGGIIGVAIIVLVVLFFVLKKSNNGEGITALARLRSGRRDRTRRAEMEGRGNGRGVGRRAGDDYAVSGRGVDEATPDEEAAAGSFANSICLDTLYPEQYRIPSLAEALVEAGLGKNRAKLVADTCESTILNTLDSDKFADGFTEADAAAIAMYTFEFDPEESEYNPYSLINKALMCEGNPESIRGLLYLVMCALRKLPRCEDKLLYRGVKRGADINRYKKGNIVMWPTIVSTSPDMKAAKQLINDDDGDDEEEEERGAGKKSKGTLFVIEDAWGYNIQPYSLSSNGGEEILLEPERRFQVDSVIQSEMTIVNLKMLDTPLVLPQVFGECIK